MAAAHNVRQPILLYKTVVFQGICNAVFFYWSCHIGHIWIYSFSTAHCYAVGYSLKHWKIVSAVPYCIGIIKRNTKLFKYVVDRCSF